MDPAPTKNFFLHLLELPMESELLGATMLIDTGADILAMVGRTLVDLRDPAALGAFASTCTVVAAELSDTLHVLQHEHSELRELCSKAGWSKADIEESDSLDWSFSSLNSDDLAVAQRLSLPHLIRFSIAGNEVGDAGVQTLVAAMEVGAFAQLVLLNLGATKMTDAGLTALVDGVSRSPLLSQLVQLNLSANSFTDAGLQHLAKALEHGVMLPRLWFLGLPADWATAASDDTAHLLQEVCAARNIEIID